MITGINFDRWKYFSIDTDDWCLPELSINGTETKREWSRKDKKWKYIEVPTKYYYHEWDTETGYCYKYTQFPIILNDLVMKGILSLDMYHEYMSEFEVSELSNIELPSKLGEVQLREDQFEVFKTLVTKRFGLCHMYTGFGKTELIAFMCYFYKYVMNWKVIVTAPNSKVLDEIFARINKRVGIDAGYNYPNDSGILVINAASVQKQSYGLDQWGDYFNDVRVIISDESEACLSPTHQDIYGRCINLVGKYGFSATPDVYCGRLDIHAGVSEATFRSKRLLDNFGGSLMCIVPKDFDITIYTIQSDDVFLRDEKLIKLQDKYLELLRTPEEEREVNPFSILPSDLRNRVDNDLFIQPQFANLLGTLSNSFPNLMVTINRTEIIDYWVSKLPDLNIIEVSGRGYRIHKNGCIRNISSDELKEIYLESNLIFGSRSLMRGVDLPDLVNSVQLYGRKSGSTIQSIGRTARKKLMNVIIIKPKDYVFSFSNQNKQRIELIKTQYLPEFNNIKEKYIKL